MSAAGPHVTVTLVKGPTGKRKDQRRVLASLGLRKSGRSVSVPDTPTIRGMIGKVLHLVTVTKGGAA